MIKISQEKLDTILKNYRDFHKIVYGSSDYKEDLRYRWFMSLDNITHKEYKFLGIVIWKETLREFYSRNYIWYGAENHLYDQDKLSKEDHSILSFDMKPASAWYKTLSKITLEGGSQVGCDNRELLDFLVTFQDDSMVKWAKGLDERVTKCLTQ